MPLLIPVLSLNLFPAETFALTAEEKGLEIAKEADRRDTGWGDYTATMTMVLYNRHGEKSERFMHTKSLEGKADGDKTTLVFDRPKDVKGTALLTYTHKAGPDDQWLFLPGPPPLARRSLATPARPHGRPCPR